MARRPAREQAKGQAKAGGSLAPGVALGEAVFRSLCAALQGGSYRAGDRLREEEAHLLAAASEETEAVPA